MTVASLCSREIVSVDHAEPLPLAARLMREHHVGTVVVTEERGDGGAHVVGIVTDRDLVIEGLARGAAACIDAGRRARRRRADRQRCRAGRHRRGDRADGQRRAPLAGARDAEGTCSA
ncbi:MAG: CBS domain-containing protein [Rubrivivax sp.]